jgi:hypothetical protein
VSDDIPQATRQFVAAHITSIAQLEALLLLRSSAPAPFSAEQVARKLYCQAEVIARQLADLSAAGILATVADDPLQFVYQPRDEATAQIVDQLADTYRDRRVAITTLIYSDSTYAMRSFADAFRLRKDKP